MRLRGGWGGASTDWSCKLSARKARGPTGAPPKSERTNRGPPPSLRAPRDTWVPAWAPGGGAGPAAAPPRAGVKRPGGAAAARAGTRPVPSGPRLRARSPSPRHGKEREGRARRPDAGVSPASPRRTGTLGSRLCQLSGVLLPPPSGRAGSSLRAWHPRGAPSPRPSQFSHPDLAESHPPTSPPRARLLTQPTSSPPAAWGARCSQHGTVYGALRPLRSPLSHACLPSL